MNILKITTIVIALLMLSIIGNASTYNTVDISTGIKADLPNNPVYPAGQNDAFWQVVSRPNGVTPVSSYVPDLTIYPFTAYVVIPGTTYINTNQQDAGDYEYQRCFCLDSPEKAQLNLLLRADNTAKVFLNQYSNLILDVTHNDSFKKEMGKAETVKGFVKGRNCLRIRVTNQGRNITGLDSQVKVSGWGAKEIVDKCCAITSKLFNQKVAEGNRVVVGNTENNLELLMSPPVGSSPTPPAAALLAKRKCVRSGGTFYEYANGTNRCVPGVARIKTNSGGQEVLSSRKEKKQCHADGGVYATNSSGSFCFKTLRRDS